LVSKEGFCNVRNGVFQQIVLQDECLKTSVTSETFANDSASFCADVAMAHVQVLENFVATQEFLYHPKVFEVFVELILGDIENPDFIVCLQAHQQGVQALGCDLVGCNLEVFELHLLLLEAGGQVL
jgi:hypothetical protein